MLYGVVAAISPTVLLATLVVLGSGRGRLNGLVFLVAFVLGQSLAYLVCFLIGSVVTGVDRVGNVTNALEVVGGIAIVALVWRRRALPEDAALGAPRSEALFARLSHVRPALSFGVGMPLGIGVKRLVITLLAATTAAGAGLTPPEDVALGGLYVVIASLAVWPAVLVYLILGARADGLMTALKVWIMEHETQLLVYSALALGLFLVADGVLQLVF